jgi:hypothetical protein
VISENLSSNMLVKGAHDGIGLRTDTSGDGEPALPGREARAGLCSAALERPAEEIASLAWGLGSIQCSPKTICVRGVVEVSALEAHVRHG